MIDIQNTHKSLSLILVCSISLLAIWFFSIDQMGIVQAQANTDSAGDTVQVIVQIDTSDTPRPYIRGSDQQTADRIQIDLAQNTAEQNLPDSAVLEHHYESIPYSVVTLSSAELADLQASTGVANIFPVELFSITLDTSNDSIGMPFVWDSGYEGEGQTIVVLDTGIYAAHNFFDGRVIDEACFSGNLGVDSVPLAGSGLTSIVSLCPNESGLQLGSGAADAQTAACYYNGSQLCNHGTHVAGIAGGGDGPDGQSYDGVARKANVIGIQIFTRFNDCNGTRTTPCVLAYNSDMLAALDYVNTTLQYSYTVASVNMSLGSGNYTDQVTCDTDYAFLKTPIDALRLNDIPTIIASGNNGYLDSMNGPGCISSAVAVGSTADDTGISSFTNSDEMVDILAPGSIIYSSLSTGGYGGYNGTSMAAPHVAGVWAILREISPTISVDDALDVLQTTGIDIFDTRSSGVHTKTLIQVDQAIAAIADPAMIALDRTAVTSTLTAGAQITHFITISNDGGLALYWSSGACDTAPNWLDASEDVNGLISHHSTEQLSIAMHPTAGVAGSYSTTVCLSNSTGITQEISASLILTTSTLADDAPNIVIDTATDRLTWLDDDSTSCTTNLHRSANSTDGFMLYQSDIGENIDLAADLSDNTNNYYYVAEIDCGTTLAPSNILGIFNFTLSDGE